MRILRAIALVALATLATLATRPALAQPAPIAASSAALVPLPPVPSAAAVVPLDPEAATRAYLDTVPADAHARSDAYFEGGYWLMLWSFLLGSGVALLLLFTGLSARMRRLASRVTRFRPVHAAVYWAQYVLVTGVLSSPLTVYEGFFREHAYGMSNMTFGAWIGDQLKGLVIALIVGGLAMMGLYAILARAKKTWWVWGTVASIGFATLALAIAPVFVEPLFNEYTPVADARVKDPILALARSNGIGAKSVLVFDASRQTKRVSANVAGFGATQRIALNDNLLNRCSLEEIEAVMGHEMGHYVLNHVTKGILQIGLVILFGFLFMRVAFERLRARFASRWKIIDVDDPAGLPLLALLFGVYLFGMTPVVNTIVRTQETEADLFGLNTSRQPDGMAAIALKLGEYRKLEPGPLEEIVFFDHPSGRNRISMAMRWKAEHVGATPLR